MRPRVNERAVEADEIVAVVDFRQAALARAQRYEVGVDAQTENLAHGEIAVLARIGRESLWFVSDGIEGDVQRRIAVRAILGEGDAQARAQRAIDEYLAARPDARVAVIPDGPYTMLRRRA